MNCTEVKSLLSAYYDAEVSADERVAIVEHLGNCSECSAEHAGFEQLSGMVQRSAPPEPALLGWEQLQGQLDGDSTFDSAEPLTRANRKFGPSWRDAQALRPILGVAALSLVALVTLGWFAFQSGINPKDDNLLATDVEHYVDEFQRDPDAAQRMLVSTYKGQKVEVSEVVPQFGYRPVAADRLPRGYTLDSMYLLRMPCCDCLQSVCRRSDGSKIVIFEFGDEQPLSAGDRSGGLPPCRGKNCCLVDVNDKFAASWKCGQRYISLVGVRDQAEMDILVASLE